MNFLGIDFRVYLQRNVLDLQLILRGKSIALIGNASGFLHTKDIGKMYDVIIRMNKGYYYFDSAGNKIVRKTDILLVSCEHQDAFLKDVPVVIRMTPKKRDR